MSYFRICGVIFLMLLYQTFRADGAAQIPNREDNVG